MNEQPIKIELYDDKGQLKSQEEFLKEMEGLYETLNEQNNVQFLDLFANPEELIIPEDILSKYQFIERKLYLNTEISPIISQPIFERIQFWNAEDEFNNTPIEERIPIQLYIDTPGGDLTTSLFLIDAIKSSKTPIYSIVTGTAYSGGFFIAIAAKKRMAFPNSTFLFHEGCTAISGDAHKASQQADFYKKYQLKQIKAHVLKSTKIPKNLYNEHEKDDWFFGAQKALELGVIDEICTDVNGGIYNEE